ncbi:G2/mitotic-specific cyclin-B1 [Pararge aegeria]|uniref:Jg1008 protein n=2 Tax=Pararge aegeria TaxID=116150 RepID=A0A8S4SH35_9NEOP|nr:G2/mitotic-specific cyclin-B1 [Pararge aegeria]CAH2266411.1 jg1008 [Pararge aegeria aegeria]
MEIQVRRNHIVHDQENVYASKNVGATVPMKHLGLNVRGALGELNTNTNFQSQPANNAIKSAISCEIENKTRRVVRCYKHVQSKVDTGLASKSIIQPSSRPPLRREESTGRLAARAVVSRAALKDTQNKPNEIKESVNVFVQAKKVVQAKKKLPTLKENAKEVKSLLKQPIGEPTESLGKLKLGDDVSTKVNQRKKEPEPTPELPDDIEDIDAKDNNTALLMSHYIKDIYRYLTKLEEKYAIEKDHLAKQVVVTGRMRATLIDWLVEVQKQFTLELETFHMTVGIIDRYLQVVTNVQRGKLQLVGVTAMFIASKYEEVFAPQVGDFVFITDNAYSASDVIQCEVEILSKLGYCLARPIPISFLRRFVKAAHGTSKNHHLAKYLVDLCLVEYSMAHYKPSELAAAAICLSLYLLSKKNLTEVWTPTLSYYSEYSLEHIEPIMRKIAKIVVNVEKSKYKAVYNKYLDISLAKVSSLPQLKSDVILELAQEA